MLDAGLTGILAAMCALIQRAAAPVNGLQNMNPYVSGTLADWTSKGLRPVIPRQLAPTRDFRSDRSVGAGTLMQRRSSTPELAHLLSLHSCLRPYDSHMCRLHCDGNAVIYAGQSARFDSIRQIYSCPCQSNGGHAL